MKAMLSISSPALGSVCYRNMGSRDDDYHEGLNGGRENPLTEMAGRPAASCLRLPDNSAERRSRADPSQGYAGDPYNRRGARCPHEIMWARRVEPEE